MTRTPRPGSGRFQWSRGGFLGAQIGSTLWLGILGGLVLRSDPGAGAVLLGCFLLPNAVGLALWSWRHRLPPFAALEALVAVAGAAAFLGARVTQRPELHLRDDWRVPPGLVVALFAGMIVLFALLERAGRGGRTA